MRLIEIFCSQCGEFRKHSAYTLCRPCYDLYLRGLPAFYKKKYAREKAIKRTSWDKCRNNPAYHERMKAYDRKYRKRLREEVK